MMTLGLLACTPTQSDEPAVPSLYLELVSLSGDAVPEARVHLSSGQQRQADARGTLLLEQLPVGSQSLGVQAQDYYPTLLVFDMAEGVRAGARLALFPLGTPFATFDASQGTTLTQGDITLTIPPGALLDARGNLIQGQVEVFLTVLDLKSGELVAAPGVLEGIPAHGADPVGLESLGMVALVFRQLGEVVPFARGIRIRGSSPGSIRVGSQGGPGLLSRSSALSGGPVQRVPGWRLDPDTGRWAPTGELGRLVETSTPGSFQWEITLDNPPALLNVALPFWWRSPFASPDNPLQAPTPAWVETACLEVRVEDARGKPVAGRMVVAQGMESLGRSLSRALTDADGRARLEVKRNQPVEVDAGEGPTTVRMGTDAGNCRGEGAAPTSATLTVPASTCTPGAVRDCGTYGGPTGTLDRGICRAARQFCDVKGTGWSACGAEVRPQEERCDSPVDDDCDGAINETCASICQPGATRPCYDGPPGTEGVGLCHAGIRMCNDSGTAWSACMGQRWPQAEQCTNLQDDDCDGQLNEASACIWASTGSMASIRDKHTATLLANGKVLVAGGNGSQALQLVELYDPASHSWSPAASMLSARFWHTATLLPSGKVLVTGGSNTTPLQTAELYDPATDSWSLAGTRMGYPRMWHTATLLPSGKVLVAGGSYLNPQQTADLYDPATNSWSSAGSMAEARSGHTATLLPSGKVLVAGGSDNGGNLQSAELYDPDTDSWSPADPMAEARSAHTATLLPSGKVLIAGGVNGGSLQRAELYDPGTNSWSSTGPMAEARYRHTATLLNNGKVFVRGAETSSEAAKTAELYDPTTNTWSPVAPNTGLPRYRAWHTATLLNNGRVLIAGMQTYPETELYSP